MCKYCQNVVLDRDGGYWQEYEEIPGLDCITHQREGCKITFNGTKYTLESTKIGANIGIHIKYCPICGRKLEI